MEDLVWDSVPAQRKRKAEKYDFPVVTMSAIEKVGAGRKFSFNKAAQELLEIEGEDRVSFGFSTDRKIIAVRKAIGDNGIQLTKTCTISDKKTYDFIVKLLNLDTSVENDFSIDVHNNLPVLNLLNHTAVTQEEETIEFEVTNVGEVSEEEDLSADVSSVPTAESFGVEAAEIEEEVEEAVMPDPTYSDETGYNENDIQEDSTEEDVW
jgi:hypothetical protein